MHAFLGVTVHGLDQDWMPQSVLLGFRALHGPHTGENMAAVLEELLEDFRLQDKVSGLPYLVICGALLTQWKQIISITTDNASNNKTLIEHLATSIDNGSSSTPWTPKEHWVRCFAHILNLVEQAVLETVREQTGTTCTDVESNEPVYNDSLSAMQALSPLARVI